MVSEELVLPNRHDESLEQSPKHSTDKLMKPPDERSPCIPPPETPSKIQKARILPQVMACLAAALGALVLGVSIGWAGTALPSLIKDPEFQPSTMDIALLVAAPGVGSLIFTAVAGRVLDLLGRRKALLSVVPIVLVGWIFSALSPNIACLIASMFLLGGISICLQIGAMVYVSEIPEARLRGRLASLPVLFINLGTLCSFGIGAAFPWRTACYVSLVPLIIFSMAMFAVPESPYWYLLKNREQEAATSMKRLRGPDYDCKPELEAMANKMSSTVYKAKISELWKPRTRQPFLIALFLHTMHQLCGAIPILIFSGTIFMEAEIALDPRMGTMYTGIVQMVSSVISMMLIDRMGRRFLLITSLLAISVCMLGLASFFWLRDIYGLRWPKWLSLLLVMGVQLSYCFGARSVPVLAAELFNTTIRSTASSTVTLYNRIINIVSVQIYPLLRDVAGIYVPFLFYGAICIVGAVVAVVVVPETKGKTLEEIQEYFESQSSKRKSTRVDSC